MLHNIKIAIFLFLKERDPNYLQIIIEILKRLRIINRIKDKKDIEELENEFKEIIMNEYNYNKKNNLNDEIFNKILDNIIILSRNLNYLKKNLY